MATTTLPATQVTSATIPVNGAKLYHEIRGSGPPVFFVQGTTGDGGSFDEVGDLLAREFTIVTYHRRGNSWSPRPSGWTTTSVDEQADDLAALIRALGMSPAVVFGTSDGATILINLLIRHPDVLRGAIVHEPLLEPLIDAGSPAKAAIDAFYAKIETAYEEGGSRAGMEALIRAVVGDAAYEAHDPARRDRVLDTADTYFSIEAESFPAWMPNPGDLARVRVPTMVAAGTVDILGGGFRLSCEWIANHLGTTVVTFPGAHTPYLDQPKATAAAMRPFLRRVSGIAPGSSSDAERRPLLHEVTGHGDPLVLVPGALSGWVSWIGHARSLSTDRTVVRVQHRGLELAGSGQPIPETYATGTETAGLLATVDSLGLDRFDLVGWSLGGHVALAFALAHPGRVRTLTLIEPAAYWILKQTRCDPKMMEALEHADRSFGGKVITPEDLKGFLVRAGLGKPGDDFESLPSWPTMMQNRQILGSIGMIWDYEHSLERLRELDVPVLVVHGTESTPHDIAIAREIAQCAPNAALLELPGDHACHLQSGEAFLAALQAFLAPDRI